MATWVNRKAALRLMDISRKHFEALVDVGQILTLQPPGWKRKLYYLPDVERNAEQLKKKE